MLNGVINSIKGVKDLVLGQFWGNKPVNPVMDFEAGEAPENIVIEMDGEELALKNNGEKSSDESFKSFENSESPIIENALKNDEVIDIVEPAIEQDMNIIGNEFDQLILQKKSTFSTPYQSLLNRLENAKYRPVGNDFNTLINHTDLTEIYDFFLNNKNPDITSQIDNLAPGKSIHLSKYETGLPRTLAILHDQNDEFKLIVETKSKLSDGTKQQLPKIGGTFKTGKPAWRVDTPVETLYFNLVAKLKDDIDLQEIEDEVALSQFFYSKYVNKNELGQVYEKNGVKKVCVYSPAARGDLAEFPRAHMTKEGKNRLILDILKGVKRFHDQNLVHQDLKLQNTLVFGKSDIGYNAKITDFGTVKAADDLNKEALATNGYQSPEIAYYYSEPTSSQYNYYHDPKYGPYLADQIAKYRHPYQGTDRSTLQAPNKANDMWAIGIMIYEILHDEKPQFPYDWATIQNNPLLKGLLEPRRENRINIDKAIEIFSLQNTSTAKTKLSV